MQIKIYVPQTIEIPNEYLGGLAQRAYATLGDAADRVAATRGHLVRQAIRDGLLRDLDHLICEDGKVDVFCDPGDEIPLEIDSRTFNVSELLEVLRGQRSHLRENRPDFDRRPDFDKSSSELAAKRSAA
jgi:hypothetical protein